MTTRVQTLLAIVCAAIAGYASFPLLNSAKHGLGDDAQVHVSCDLSPEQVERLSARLAAIETKVASSDARSCATQTGSAEISRDDKAKAFLRATEIVDRMINNREVTPDGMREAHSLLQQTGQTDRGVELGARIARAINRGDLTPEQAGMLPTSP